MVMARWHRIEDVFTRAIDLAPGERMAFLERECGHDAELLAEVTSLLAGADEADASLERTISAAVESLARASSARAVGARVGPYRLVRVLGEGGMGTVYLAERADAQFAQCVAIKLMRHELASRQMVARFRAERQILASLEHPSIVRLLDGGSTDEGIPYLVMEYVEGEPLLQHVSRLPVRGRMEIIVRAARALQYAHERLIVHRDIKPSNIVVDTHGSPKLLDFGIAKLLVAPHELPESQTRTGMALLTPEYASPEQARGEVVTVATDVYSLGAVLYHVLCGQPPQRAGASPLETLRNICDHDPARPSAAARAPLRRALAGDIDNIVLKALQKDPERRYPSAAALADDLCAYLDGRPVAARDATLGYRARKFVMRNRGKLAIALLVVSALATSTVVSVVQARRASRQAAEAERQKRSLLRERGIQEVASGHSARAMPYLVEAMREGDDSAALRLVIADAMRPLSRQLAAVDASDGESAIAWAPDGARFAVAEYGGHLSVYDAAGRLQVRVDRGDLPWGFLMFSRDGARIAACTPRGTVSLWDAHTGATLATLESPDPDVVGMAMIANDERLVLATAMGAIIVADARTGALRGGTRIDSPAVDAFGHRLNTVFAAPPDGRWVAVGGLDGSIYLWNLDPAARPRRLDGHVGKVTALHFGRDGTRLYSAADDHIVRVWDAAAGRALATFAAHDHAIISLDVDRDETLIATTAADDTAALRDARSGALVAVMRGLVSRGILVMRFSPDGSQLVSLGVDGTFRLWDRRGTPGLVLEGAPGAGEARHSAASATLDMRFSPDGTRLLTASSREVDVWRVDRDPLIAELRFDRPVYGAAPSPDGRRLALVGREIAGVWDMVTGGWVKRLDLAGRSGWDAAWRPDGARLALVGTDGYAAIFDRDAVPVRTLVGHRATVNRVAWSPDGRLVLTAGDDRGARIWDGDTGAPVRVLAHPDRVLAASWRRDGGMLVTACWDRRLRLWDTASGALVATMATDLELLDASFSPDGQQLVASSHNGDVGVWNVATGARTLSLEGHTDSVPMATWSSDGSLLATAGYDGSLRLWDPATGVPLVARHGGELMGMAWSGGDRVVSASENGRVYVWDVHRAGESLDELQAFIALRVPFRLVDTHLARTRH
jgi:WD40 repeat protein/tRNA A-37 threonylcarbamoyl transferase component Bud32